MIDVTVPGEPVAKARPRAVRRGNSIGTYTPKKTAQWEKRAVHLINEKWASIGATDLHDGPLAIYILTVSSRPKRLMRKRDPDGRVPMDKRPDTDNLEKAILDAITKSGAIKDDAQICCVSKWHWYAAKENDGPFVQFRLLRWQWAEHWTCKPGVKL